MMNSDATIPACLTDSFFAKIFDGQRSNRPAIQAEDQVLTYGNLTHLIESAAQQLLSLGIEPGDKVVIVFPNCTEHILAVLAALSLGAVVVPVSCDEVGERINTVLKDITPLMCLVHPGVSITTDVQVHKLQIEFSNKSITLSPGSGPGRVPKPGIVNSKTGAVTEDSTSFIRYSSGSTGQPKGVVLKRKHLLWTAQTLSFIFNFDQQHRELLIAPIAYSGGWQRVAATLYCGGCIVIPQGPVSVSGMLEDIETYNISGFFTPPPLVRMLLASPVEHARKVLSNCRTIEIGSAPITAAELEQLSALAPTAQIFVHYGMTECSRAVILNVKNNPDKLATVGKPAPGVELTIIGEDGQNLETGKAGEIFLKGPQQAISYWHQPTLTAERFVDGWIASGDYGRLDDQGFLTYLGRKDDMINCGGYSFFPAEIEAELGELEDIKHYLIAGVPDPRGILGQVPWAFVVPIKPEKYSTRTFFIQAKKRLAPHKVPRWVVMIPELPLTRTGKPDRRSAVATYAPGSNN